MCARAYDLSLAPFPFLPFLPVWRPSRASSCWPRRSSSRAGSPWAAPCRPPRLPPSPRTECLPRRTRSWSKCFVSLQISHLFSLFLSLRFQIAVLLSAQFVRLGNFSPFIPIRSVAFARETFPLFLPFSVSLSFRSSLFSTFEL